MISQGETVDVIQLTGPALDVRMRSMDVGRRLEGHQTTGWIRARNAGCVMAH